MKQNRRKRRRTPRQQQLMMRRMTVFGAGILIILSVIIGGWKIVGVIRKGFAGRSGNQAVFTGESGSPEGRPELDVQLLTPNPYSRPQTKLKKVKGIVIHYVANPGTTAQNNRDYFEGLKNGSRSASSHFIVGLEGEIIQCIPTAEISYASNERNEDTIAIECCHPDETGEFNQYTYQSVVQLTAWLCVNFDLEASDVIRHYDVTGKNCPKYFVDHEDKWEQFLEDVASRIKKIKD